MNTDGIAEYATRRRFLASVAGASAVGLAGCGELGGSDSDGTPVPSDAETLPTPVLGDPDADVTVMAFEDYACGHCASYVLQEFPQLIDEYVKPGQIRYEHHDFPLPLSQQSWRAPSAARAVQDTVGPEAYWQFSQSLYANQSSLGPELYATLAEEVGADPETVRTAAVEERYETTVRADRQYGDGLGVDSTPTVFVDGSALDSYAFDAISQAIEDAL